MIPPDNNGKFVAHMEKVLDIYKRPYDEKYPVVCMDESPKQLIGETKTPVPMSPGNVAKYDYEYKRNGTCSIFLASEPLSGKRLVTVKPRRTKKRLGIFFKRGCSAVSFCQKDHSGYG